MKIMGTVLLLQFIFLIDVNSENPSGNTSWSHDDSVSNFQPSLGVVIGMLAVMFSLTFILLLYAKFCHRSSSDNTVRIQDGLPRLRSGVDKCVVESLPFFPFSSLKGWKQGLECSVCLAKFEDVEMLRLLPTCKHAFHVDCIDRWLEKHSTCPLCRRQVSADDLSCSTSLRFLREDCSSPSSASVELFVEREDNNGSSSRFRKQEELAMRQDLHRFNHKIDVVLKNRWSSSDLDSYYSSLHQVNGDQEMEMTEIKINPTPINISGSELKALNPKDKRSMSEIIVHPRFSNAKNEDHSEEERIRSLWLPIATKTLQRFADRELKPPQGLNV